MKPKRRNPASRTVIYGEVEYKAPTPGVPVIAASTLANGIYKGVRFKVLMNHGMSPCAYISLDDKQEIIVDILDHLIHGGITYRGEHLKGDYKKYEALKRKWIGWDYAHIGDFNPIIPTSGGRRWTTEAIVSDVKKVIDSIKTVEKGQNSGQTTHTSQVGDTSTNAVTN